MRKFIFGLPIFFLVIIFPLCLYSSDYLAEADSLYNQGGIENFKRSIDLYSKVSENSPGYYEAVWKSARACREYGNEAKKKNLRGWKDICAEYGKMGMHYALKAIEIEPGKADGHYYYSLSVGTYSDGVSILTALREGLKNKTQQSLERSYELDKMYNDAGPMLSLGRFWAVLPWPLRDRKKALKFYREYQATPYFVKNMEARVFFAELLIELGGKQNIAEAKGHLEKATQSDNAYYKKQALRFLADLK